MKKYLVVLLFACAAGVHPARDAFSAQSSAGVQLATVESPSVERVSGQGQAQGQDGVAAGRSAGADAAPSSGGQWRAMMDGVLANLGALLSRLGIGGALGGIVALMLVVALIAFILVLVVRLARRSDREVHPMREPVFASAYVAAGAAAGAAAGIEQPQDRRVEPQPRPQPAARTAPPAAGGNPAAWGVPADFDVPGFLRNAKAYFIRLQASWDRSDIDDLREFTAPEIFAELSLQLQERGAAHSQTTVAILNADLLGIETTGTDYIASVKFSGMIRESGRAMAEPFIEIWSLSKPVADHGPWLLAGIQQLQ